MRHEMNKDKRILAIIAILIAVAILATYWSIISPVGSPPERLGWGRWNLADEQREEIEQLIKNMQINGTRPEAIQAAIIAKLDEWRINPPPPGDIELFYTVKTVISTINVALVLILLFTYIEIYNKTKSNFTIGLMMFSIILVFYTLASNPIMQWVFGFRAFGLGPFAMLPDVFACIALSVLLYLSVKY
jgi:hypothetical protein